MGLLGLHPKRAGARAVPLDVTLPGSREPFSCIALLSAIVLSILHLQARRASIGRRWEGVCLGIVHRGPEPVVGGV